MSIQAHSPSIAPWRTLPSDPGLLILLIGFGFAALGLAITPAAAFSVDGSIYAEMARAMAERGAFAIAANGGVEGAPALLHRLTADVGGATIPQYPGGYGIIAAPFY
ncbi:MAG: hypothetical protein AAFQ67_09500, partial [Pseudomonadota bacterium]